jgi:hypothetical protein
MTECHGGIRLRFIGSNGGKRNPYEPSEDEWADLANHTHDIEPTNLGLKSVIRNSAWRKSTWNDVRKYLHAVFVMYNRSGQNDPDMGEWCSPKEQECWVQASLNKTNGSNTIVHFPTIMIYSISVLEEADFESLGREIPKGTGIDNSVNDGAVATGGKRKRKGKQNKKKKGSAEKDSTVSLIRALDGGTKSETKMSALCLMLEFGSTEEKLQAMREVRHVALEGGQESTEPTVTVGE